MPIGRYIDEIELRKVHLVGLPTLRNVKSLTYSITWKSRRIELTGAKEICLLVGILTTSTF